MFPVNFVLYFEVERASAVAALSGNPSPIETILECGVVLMMKNVLVVDRDSRLLLDLAQTWAFQSWRTITASSPQEAIDILEDEIIHVVVINEEVTWLQGTSLLELIRHQYPEITQILLTADYDVMEEISAFDNGVFQCFLIPTDKESLRVAVQHALASITCNRIDGADGDEGAATHGDRGAPSESSPTEQG
jgi:DNA-binding NtrC family response regulator